MRTPDHPLDLLLARNRCLEIDIAVILDDLGHREHEHSMAVILGRPVDDEAHARAVAAARREVARLEAERDEIAAKVRAAAA